MTQSVVLNKSGSTSLTASSKIRLAKDLIAQYSITAGGLMVLMTLLMIFGYLLYVVEPVFRSAEMHSGDSHRVNSAPLALGSDELNEVGYFYNPQGQLNFYSLLEQQFNYPSHMKSPWLQLEYKRSYFLLFIPF